MNKGLLRKTMRSLVTYSAVGIVQRMICWDETLLTHTYERQNPTLFAVRRICWEAINFPPADLPARPQTFT